MTTDPPASRSAQWHSRSWWASVGSIATVLALGVAALAWWFPRSADSSTPQNRNSAKPSFVDVIQTGTAEVTTTTFSPDGRLVATGGGNDHTVRLWNSTTGELVRLLRGTAVVNAMAFSPDGATLITNGGLELWNVATGEPEGSLRGGRGAVIYSITGGGGEAVAFSPDGKTIATGTDDNYIHLWDVATREEMRSLRIADPVSTIVDSIAFSADGKILAACGYEGTIWLWNTTTGTQLRTLTHPGEDRPALFLPSRQVAFGSHGNLATSGGGTVRIWNTSTGELSHILTDSNQVVFSPDGRTVATASTRDYSVQLWNVANGAPLHSFPGHTDMIAGLSFSPDGRLLAAGGIDHTVRLWDVSPFQP